MSNAVKRFDTPPDSVVDLLTRAAFPFIRIAGHAKTIGPRESSDTTVTLTSEDRAGFYYAIDVGAQNKARIYLKIKDVKTRALDKAGDELGYDWRTFLLYEVVGKDGRPSVRPVNTKLEVIPGTKDAAAALVTYGLTDREPAYNELTLIDLEKAVLPVTAAPAGMTDAVYTVARTRLDEYTQRCSALKFFIDAGKKWAKAKWPDANDFVAEHGEEALLKLFPNAVRADEGMAYLTRPAKDKSDTYGTLEEDVIIEVPYCHYEFCMDLPDLSMREAVDAQYSPREKVGRSFVYDIGALLRMQDELGGLKERADSTQHAVRAYELGVLFNGGAIGGTEIVLSDMVDQRRVRLAEAADYCARYGVEYRPTATAIKEARLVASQLEQ